MATKPRSEIPTLRANTLSGRCHSIGRGARIAAQQRPQAHGPRWGRCSRRRVFTGVWGYGMENKQSKGEIARHELFLDSILKSALLSQLGE